MLTIQDIRTKDEGAGHPTERGSKLKMPLQKLHELLTI